MNIFVPNEPNTHEIFRPGSQIGAYRCDAIMEYLRDVAKKGYRRLAHGIDPNVVAIAKSQLTTFKESEIKDISQNTGLAVQCFDNNAFENSDGALILDHQEL